MNGPRLLCGWLLAATSMAATAAADFSGTWLPDGERAQAWPAELPLTPAARSFMQGFDPASHDPTAFCMPFGTPRNMLQTQFPLQIVQQPDRLVIILQPNLSNAEVRRIRLGAAALPESPEPTWFGTSRGTWQGATLVVETIGLREDSLLSGHGLPHSDRLRVVERLRVEDDPRRGKVLVSDIELHDPLSFTQALHTRRYFVLAPRAQFTEENCVARQWTDKLWHDRLREHAEAARAAQTTP